MGIKRFTGPSASASFVAILLAIQEEAILQAACSSCSHRAFFALKQHHDFDCSRTPVSLEECLKYSSEYPKSGLGMNSDVDVLQMNKDKVCFTAAAACSSRTVNCCRNHTASRKETGIASGIRQISTVFQLLPTVGQDVCGLRSTFYRRIIMPAGRARDILAGMILFLTVFSCVTLPAGALDVGMSTLSCLFILQ